MQSPRQNNTTKQLRQPHFVHVIPRFPKQPRRPQGSIKTVDLPNHIFESVSRCSECCRYMDHAYTESRHYGTNDDVFKIHSGLLNWDVVGVNEWTVSLVLPGNILCLHNGLYHIEYYDSELPRLITTAAPCTKKRSPNESSMTDLDTIPLASLPALRIRRITDSLSRTHVDRQ